MGEITFLRSFEMNQIILCIKWINHHHVLSDDTLAIGWSCKLESYFGTTNSFNAEIWFSVEGWGDEGRSILSWCNCHWWPFFIAVYDPSSFFSCSRWPSPPLSPLVILCTYSLFYRPLLMSLIIFPLFLSLISAFFSFYNSLLFRLLSHFFSSPSHFIYIVMFQSSLFSDLVSFPHSVLPLSLIRTFFFFLFILSSFLSFSVVFQHFFSVP